METESLALYLRDNLSANQDPPAAWGLPELTLAAFFYNPQLDIARAQWAVAKGREKTAAERPNPSLSVTPGFNSTTGYGADISPWIVEVALDIPIETAGKRGYRVAEAQHLSEAARLHIAQTAWETRRQVRHALLDLYAAGQSEALIDRRRRLQADNVRLLEQLFEIGEISANELSRARVQRDEVRLAGLDVGARRAQARARLAAAIGVPIRALKSVQFSFEAFERLPEDVPPTEARRRALLQREDLLAALADYRASQAALQAAIARQYPDIQLGPGYEFDQSEDKWVVGLSVSLPLFHRNQGAIATAEAQREKDAATFRGVQARIVAEVEQGVIECQTSMRKVKAAEAIVTQQTRTVDRVRKMYEAGELLASEVTAAELELNAGSANLLDAHLEALRAFGRLENAMHVAADLPHGVLPIVTHRSGQQGDNDHE